MENVSIPEWRGGRRS
jgi:hypothetical protein